MVLLILIVPICRSNGLNLILKESFHYYCQQMAINFHSVNSYFTLLSYSSITYLLFTIYYLKVVPIENKYGYMLHVVDLTFEDCILIALLGQLLVT